jgi:small subunit ribosomal protein S6
MAKYETMFITRTDIPEEEIDKLVAQMEGVVANTEGKIEKVEKMGRRRLAYRVQKQREGYYLLFVFEGTGNTVREFERRLKVSDAVIKHMSVRLDERVKPPAPAKPAAAEPAASAPAGPEVPTGDEAASQS